MQKLFIISLCLLVIGCVPVAPVNQSQEILWNKFANQPLDNVLLAWGAPAAETHLTEGSRLVTYRHSTTYEALSPYEHTLGCEVSFLAKPPGYLIGNIAMQGDAYECSLLAQGQTGYRRDTYVPPPPPYYGPRY
jgi:hypothetical protein